MSQPEPRSRTRLTQPERQITVIAVKARKWSEHDRILRRKCESQIGILTSIPPRWEVSQSEPRFRTRPAQLERQITVIAVRAWKGSKYDRIIRRKCNSQIGNLTSIPPRWEVSQPEPRSRTRPTQPERQITVIAVKAWKWSEHDRILRRKCKSQIGILTSISHV